MDPEPFEVSEARIKFGNSSWKGFEKMSKYHMSEKMSQRIQNDYTYHAPKEDQPSRYERIRNVAKNLAIVIVEETPESREQSVALTQLDGVVMNANAAIARNE